MRTLDCTASLHKSESDVHISGNLLQPIKVSSANFCRSPTGIVDFEQCFANVSPVDVAFADLCELVLFTREAL